MPNTCYVCFFFHRLVLEELHLGARVMVLIGLSMSIMGIGLMGDWQAIKFDPCTDRSLFHHLELLHTYTSELATPVHSESVTGCVPCERQNLSTTVLQGHQYAIHIYAFPVITKKALKSGCDLVASCPLCTKQGLQRMYTIGPTCLHLIVDPARQCLQPANPDPSEITLYQPAFFYSCSMYKSLFEFCMRIPVEAPPELYATVEEYVEDVYAQSILVIEGRVAALAKRSCEEMPHYSCHWNPHSSVTSKECEDCPPICRKKTNYLNFSQFCIGAALLLISVPLARVPITSLISDLVPKDGQVINMKGFKTSNCVVLTIIFLPSQGIIMGIAQALNAVARTVGPLWREYPISLHLLFPSSLLPPSLTHSRSLLLYCHSGRNV